MAVWQSERDIGGTASRVDAEFLAQTADEGKDLRGSWARQFRIFQWPSGSSAIGLAKCRDEKLTLKDRTTRDEWIEQAKELLKGKAPLCARIDQKKAKA